MELPVLQLISRGDTRWHLLWQDLAASLQQLEYRELAGQLTRAMQRMPEPLCKGKVMHLLRWVPALPCMWCMWCMWCMLTLLCNGLLAAPLQHAGDNWCLLRLSSGP
jgi:hypothetical protein